MRCSLLFLLVAGRVLASGAGSSGAEFLRVAPGARAAAMGENFTGLADDVTAAAWNPAGLARLKGIELAAMHLAYLGDATHEFLAAGAPFGGLGSFALLGTYVNVPSFDSTDPLASAKAPAGSGGDALAGAAWGACLGPFVPEEPWYKDVYVGAAVKYIRRSLGGYVDAAGAPKTYAASTVAVDLGALDQVRQDLAVGVAVQNLGGALTFLGDERDPLPLTARLGVAWTAYEGGWLNATVLADLVRPMDPAGGTFAQALWGGVGAEARLGEWLALRAGARQAADGFRAVGGAGVSFGGIGVDVAYVPLGELGGGLTGLRFGLTAKLGAGGGPHGLAAPRNLAAAPLPGSGAHLSWDAQEAAEGYHVEVRRPGDAAFLRITRVPRPSPEMSLKGLKPASDYAFRVVPLDAKGREGPASVPVTLRTAAARALGAPAKVRAIPGRRKVTIAWSPVAGAKGYLLYIRGGDGKWKALTKTPLLRPRITMKGQPGIRVFAVLAVDPAGARGKARVVKTSILR